MEVEVEGEVEGVGMGMSMAMSSAIFGLDEPKKWYSMGVLSSSRPKLKKAELGP